MTARLMRYCGVVGAVVLAAACTGHHVDPATLAPDVLFSRADSLYQAHEYGKAIPLLDAFVQNHLGDPRAPQAEFMLGKSYAARHDYLTAATHYQRLVSGFPGSAYDVQARFGLCDSYQHLSPEPALDQEYTHSALIHCQSVAENFPGTPEAEQAAKYVVEMREKLAEKLFNTGIFYVKRRAYDAAVVYLRSVVVQFPNTTSAPKALKQLAETYSKMGYVEDAQAARDQLLKEYPQSGEAQAMRPVGH